MFKMRATMPLCRLQVSNPSYHRHGLHNLDPSISVSENVRRQWIKNVIEQSNEELASQQKSTHLRDWDFILHPEGTVANAAQNFSTELLTTDLSDKTVSVEDQKYPTRYQLPQEVLCRFDNEQEKVVRMEQFAVGSILYQISTSQRPFHNRSDDEVNILFANGEFPEDVWNQPTAKSILCHWCPEFAAELQVPLTTRFQNYVQNNPGRFTLQVLGGTAAIASVAAVPVLGAIGFAATGPLAGSAAAAWQASIGAVSAGSVFAWCQSAAMGGAAVGSIIATGVSGLTVAAGATALQALEGSGPEISADELKEKFEKVWKKNYG